MGEFEWINNPAKCKTVFTHKQYKVDMYSTNRYIIIDCNGKLISLHARAN